MSIICVRLASSKLQESVNCNSTLILIIVKRGMQWILAEAHMLEARFLISYPLFSSFVMQVYKFDRN